MTTIQQWLASPEIKKLKAAGPGSLFSKQFFRDPFRAIYVDPTAFYAPADGIILYAHQSIGPAEAICDVKGRKFTVQDLLDDPNYTGQSLVIGIFMTQYDVHVNRVPTKGYLKDHHKTPYLFTPRISMIFEEEDIMKGSPKSEDLSYLFCNERRVSKIYNPDIRSSYYLVQIAERDVDEIVNWNDNGAFFNQGERFGIVRSGSQVDLVIPIQGGARFELVVQPKTHVEAGIDALVKIQKTA